MWIVRIFDIFDIFDIFVLMCTYTHSLDFDITHHSTSFLGDFLYSLGRNIYVYTVFILKHLVLLGV